MKTLIINGSPKRNGDTEALIGGFCAHLRGEVKIISCHSDISPCNDCRFCWTNSGCGIDDEMQDVYSYIEVCDNVVIASPIWFSSLSGPLLSLASRLQTFYAAKRFRQTPEYMKRKRGVIILAGAEPGTEIAPIKTALTIMKLLNVDRAGVDTITSLDTDTVPAVEDRAALEKCRAVAESLSHQISSFQK